CRHRVFDHRLVHHAGCGHGTQRERADGDGHGHNLGQPRGHGVERRRRDDHGAGLRLLGHERKLESHAGRCRWCERDQGDRRRHDRRLRGVAHNYQRSLRAHSTVGLGNVLIVLAALRACQGAAVS
ncbi:MAG: hypothetical protein ACK55Z_35230, partial [bacterium]